MRMFCAAALLGLCVAAPCRADDLSRWLDERAREYALAQLGLEEGEPYGQPREELLDLELRWLADDGELPWDLPTHRLGPPRLLPPKLRLSMALAERGPQVGVILEFPFPRRFPVPRPSPPLEEVAPDRDLDALLAGEPPIAAVQRAAIRYVACDSVTLGELERDSRAYAALPELTLGGGLDADRDVDMDPFDNVEGAQDGSGWDLSVDLEWDLGDLVMSYERIRILAQQQDRMELRADVLEEVTRRYFDRQRVRAELVSVELDRTGDEELRLMLELAEITAGLDALTGGEFSRLVQERGGAGTASF